MERKQFVRQGVSALGLIMIAPLMNACKKADTAASGTTTSGNGTGGSTCTAAPTETAGPFPTITPASYVRSDIREDRTGIPFSLEITIQNVNNSCAALAGAIVDIWHCDKDGYYSEYGGTAMQAVNYTAVHFLRGRQTTDSNGKVGFQSIFPGWYSGRATHIHVHIYRADGTSLKITQIAFPEGSGSVVATVNAQSAAGYTKGMTGYTYNAADNVFMDDTAGVQVAAVSGSVASGYALTHIIKVAS